MLLFRQIRDLLSLRWRTPSNHPAYLPVDFWSELRRIFSQAWCVSRWRAYLRCYAIMESEYEHPRGWSALIVVFPFGLSMMSSAPRFSDMNYESGVRLFLIPRTWIKSPIPGVEPRVFYEKVERIISEGRMERNRESSSRSGSLGQI